MEGPDGYECVGSVAVINDEAPDPHKYCCVKREYLLAAERLPVFKFDRGVIFKPERRSTDSRGLMAGSFVAKKLPLARVTKRFLKRNILNEFFSIRTKILGVYSSFDDFFDILIMRVRSGSETGSNFLIHDFEFSDIYWKKDLKSKYNFKNFEYRLIHLNATHFLKFQI